MLNPTGAAKAARADLQSIYDRFLKRTCGVKHASSLRAVLLEELSLDLALSPQQLQVSWWQQTLELS